MRFLVKTKIFLSCFLLAFLGNQAVLASEVSVLSSVVVLGIADDWAEGYLTTQVVNTGDSSVHNVDLRLDNDTKLQLDKELLQFGRLDVGELRAVSTRFYAPQAIVKSEMLILWQVDYDETDGAHRQGVVLSEAVP